MIRNHDNAHAQQELERALFRADKIGLKPLSAQAHYLLGTHCVRRATKPRRSRTIAMC